MAKKPSWRAKAMYLVFALALVAGLVPVFAAPAAGAVVLQADFFADRTCAPIGGTVQFFNSSTPTANPPQIAWAWAMPADWVFTGATTPASEDIQGYFSSGGFKTISLTTTWNGPATDTATKTNYVFVGVGLEPRVVQYNVLGAASQFCVPAAYAANVTCWQLVWQPAVGGSSDGSFLRQAGGNTDPPCRAGVHQSSCITVGGATEAGWLVITAFTDLDIDGQPGNDVVFGEKKWAKIDHTNLWWWDEVTSEWLPAEGGGRTMVRWYEDRKAWEGAVTIREDVRGLFPGDDPTIGAGGAIVHWWLVPATADTSWVKCTVLMQQSANQLISQIMGIPRARHVTFGGIPGQTYTTTVSDEDGITELTLVASGEEAVKLIVLAVYPGFENFPNYVVCPEFASWTFWTQQGEKVPQVRWAGEKIVLEKEFGVTFMGDEVSFKLENQSPGTLESVYPQDRDEDMGQTVWTRVTADGVARCILTSESPGEVDVDAALWDMGRLINQHGFVVFFLKFEDLTLTKVVGNRTDNPLTSPVEGHDSGVWTPENPWNNATDVTSDIKNVSADSLLRARVRGWFMGDNLSGRLARSIYIDPADPDLGNLTLPAGRWILPDDWKALAGANWQKYRPHWDIMFGPGVNFFSAADGLRVWVLAPPPPHWVIVTPADKMEELGAYYYWQEYAPVFIRGDLKAEMPFIGPYSSLDDYTPQVNFRVSTSLPAIWPLLPGPPPPPAPEYRKTIAQDALLDRWDAPMPPAKIALEVQSGPGFFKQVDKGDVYYRLIDEYPETVGGETIVYTLPFYYAEMPASPWIPPFDNNGGMDWDSWGFPAMSTPFDTGYGPYHFWDIFNQNQGTTPTDPLHATAVEVYSDNHGEAMVWLNGDHNLVLSSYIHDGVYDVPTGTLVGTSVVRAYADYPYMRKHDTAVSGTVSDGWVWGKEILGYGSFADATYMVYQTGGVTTGKKLAFVWVCDRDGKPAAGEQILWDITGDNAGAISRTTGQASMALPDIILEDGFLAGTGGTALDINRLHGQAFTRLPTDAEIALFETRFGRECHHAVAAVEFISSVRGLNNVHISFWEPREAAWPGAGWILRDLNIDWTHGDPVSAVAIRGDANRSGGVDMGDVVMVERMILGLNAPTGEADANQNGMVDMGDVTKIERIILGI